MKTFTPNEGQLAAAEAVREWWATDRQTFVLTGYAGTGKTSLMRYILARHMGPAIVGAPTGKAAHRLRSTGVPASTIHKLAYEFRGDDDLGKLLFEFKGLERSDALVVIDEASMVDERIYQDLMGRGYRMLFVGDPGQLPPIGDSPGILGTPDAHLEKIERQENGGLLDFCHALRAGRYLPPANNEVFLWPRWDEAGVDRILTEVDVALCYKNSTRRRLNLQMLKLKGLIEDGDKPSDLWPQLLGKTFRVVGLRNVPRFDIYNGSEAEFTLRDYFGDTLYGSIDTGFDTVDLDIDARGFLAEDIPADVRKERGILLFDFGYCLTVHKSQGSEWRNVAVYDDTCGTIQHQARWCYTAATRAQRTLTWIHNGPGPTGPKKNIPAA
jgi:exodeoxyribonuclease-5